MEIVVRQTSQGNIENVFDVQNESGDEPRVRFINDELYRENLHFRLSEAVIQTLEQRTPAIFPQYFAHLFESAIIVPATASGTNSREMQLFDQPVDEPWQRLVPELLSTQPRFKEDFHRNHSKNVSMGSAQHDVSQSHSAIFADAGTCLKLESAKNGFENAPSNQSATFLHETQSDSTAGAWQRNPLSCEWKGHHREVQRKDDSELVFSSDSQQHFQLRERSKARRHFDNPRSKSLLYRSPQPYVKSSTITPFDNFPRRYHHQRQQSWESSLSTEQCFSNFSPEIAESFYEPPRQSIVQDKSQSASKESSQSPIKVDSMHDFSNGTSTESIQPSASYTVLQQPHHSTSYNPLQNSNSYTLDNLREQATTIQQQGASHCRRRSDLHSPTESKTHSTHTRSSSPESVVRGLLYSILQDNVGDVSSIQGSEDSFEIEHVQNGPQRDFFKKQQSSSERHRYSGEHAEMQHAQRDGESSSRQRAVTMQRRSRRTTSRCQSTINLQDLKESQELLRDIWQPTIRGSDNWAPPRHQVIYHLHSRSKMSKSEAMRQQNFRCYNCGLKVELSSLYQKFRWCEYTGKYFCTSCHKRDKALIPARIVSNWDFRRFYVSKFAAEVLVSIANLPVFDLEDLNPKVIQKVTALRRMNLLRIKLKSLRDYLGACRFGEDLLRLAESNNNLVTSSSTYSLMQLVQLKSGNLYPEIAKIATLWEDHVMNCSLCRAKGHYCVCCDNENDLLFPFQIDRIHKCPSCKAIFHESCFSKTKKCLLCERRQKYASLRKNSNASRTS